MKKIFFTTLLLISYICTHAQSLSNTTWTNYLLDGSSFNVRLSLDTLYTNAADGINYESIATYEVDGNNFTIQDIASIGCLPDDIGSYTFIIENDTLNFTLLNDSCEGRSFAIGEGIWVRIPAPILYVNQDATGANDGSSWENAYTSLHDALENYNENDEIWVAAGTYHPQNSSVWSDTIQKAFYLYQDLALYGGFNGTETALDQRDYSINVTVLSGDIEGDDVMDNFAMNRSDNASHVLFIENTVTDATIIDGFTIQNGHAGGENLSIDREISGGGLFSIGAAQVKNCQFQQNFASRSGAAVFYLNTNGRIDNCVFDKNTANIGGGGMVFGSDNVFFGGAHSENRIFEVNNCQFTNNEGSAGGAIAIQTIESDSNQIIIKSCDFQHNEAISLSSATPYYHGGAIMGLIDASNNTISIEDCTFNDNTAEEFGGAIWILSEAGATNTTTDIKNCTFIDNSAVIVGGAIQEEIYGTNHSTKLHNCTFMNNLADVFGGAYREYIEGDKFQLSIDDCLFDGNEGIIDGGGIEIVHVNQAYSNIAIRNTTFMNNRSEREGAGLNVFNQDNANLRVIVENTLFSNNINTLGDPNEFLDEAGGFSLNNFGEGQINLDIKASIFKDNSSEDGSGAIQLYKIGTTTTDSINIENSLFYGNSGGEYVGGIGVEGNIHLALKNTTIADNVNGGIRMNEGNLELQNTILFNPTSFDFSATGSVNILSMGGNLVGDTSMNNILTVLDKSETDPLFAGIDDYQLTENSPAIDAGIANNETTDFDLAGNDRIQGGCIDIGAYESPFDAGTACVTSTREVIVENGNLTIFPNPVTDVTTIAIDNDWQGTLQLRIVNALGQEVISRPILKTAAPSQWQVNVSDLAVGIYQVLISDGERMMVEKFSKMQP